MLLGWWYNDQNGAENCWIRNFINAAGYLSFVYGAIEVAIGSQAKLSGTSCQWFFLIGGIIFSTVQIQDMPDQEGDETRGRRTLPLVIGDMPARWSIVIFVAFWSLIAPTFWRLGLGGYILPVVLSGLIAGRLLWKRAVEDDKFSFKIWNVWVVAIYALPILKVLGSSS
jgi:4-hydroxybenzoate polyprenyltransferase